VKYKVLGLYNLVLTLVIFTYFNPEMLKGKKKTSASQSQIFMESGVFISVRNLF